MRRVLTAIVFLLMISTVYASCPIVYKSFMIKNDTRYRFQVVMNNRSATRGFKKIINPGEHYTCDRAQCDYHYPRGLKTNQGVFYKKYILKGLVTVPRCGTYMMLPGDFITITLSHGKIVCLKSYRV